MNSDNFLPIAQSPNTHTDFLPIVTSDGIHIANHNIRKQKFLIDTVDEKGPQGSDQISKSREMNRPNTWVEHRINSLHQCHTAGNNKIIYKLIPVRRTRFHLLQLKVHEKLKHDRSNLLSTLTPNTTGDRYLSPCKVTPAETEVNGS